MQAFCYQYIDIITLPFNLYAGLIRVQAEIQDQFTVISLRSSREHQLQKSPGCQLYHNASIYTLNPKHPWAEAMLISRGKIVQIGSLDGINAVLTGQEEVIDLEGSMVLPGFVDAHAHPSHAVDFFENINLYQLHTIEQYENKIRKFIADHPDRDFFRGSGWDNSLFPPSGPNKERLDRISVDKPIVLISYDYHSMWVNSAMLERAGIKSSTPSPAGGVIEKDTLTGQPNGTLRETAMKLVEAVLPAYSQDQRTNTIMAYQEMAFQAGITLSHDAMVDQETIRSYQALAAAGSLRMNLRASFLIEPGKPVGEQVEMLVEMRAVNKMDKFQIHTAKLFIDGVVEGGTAYLLEPYTNQPGYSGELIWEPGLLKETCAALDKEQIQIHMHVIGDAAARIALDALEYAREINGRRDARHLITHLQLVAPVDIPRFRQLDVIVVPNPFWFKIDDYYSVLAIPYLGKKRADRQYPMRSFLQAGVRLASASDFPVTIPCDPLIGIELGFRRMPVGAQGCAILWPEERVNLEEMIATFTINGAHANFLEKQTGSLEVGKQADFVVLDQDLFKVDPADIAGIKVLNTYVDGEQVYLNKG